MNPNPVIRTALLSCLLLLNIAAPLRAQSEGNTTEPAYDTGNETSSLQQVYMQTYNIKGLNQATTETNRVSGFENSWASQPTIPQPQPKAENSINNINAFRNKNTYARPQVNQDYERGFKERYQQMMENQNRPMPDGEGEEVNSEAEE